MREKYKQFVQHLKEGKILRQNMNIMTNEHIHNLLVKLKKHNIHMTTW